MEQVFSEKNLAAIRAIDPAILDRVDRWLRVEMHVKRCQRCRRRRGIPCPVLKAIQTSGTPHTKRRANADRDRRS